MKNERNSHANLASDVDERVPRYRSVFTEHHEIQQRALTVTVTELVLFATNDNDKRVATEQFANNANQD